MTLTVACPAVVLVRCSSPFPSAGKAFLDANAKAEGVTVLPSGLQYKVLSSSGSTLHPNKADTVRVHYRGTTIDGKEFDSSYKRGQPATFGVTQVISGWTEILQIMGVGDKYEVTIPSNLAYGARGAGGLIAPNSVLVFTIELLGIEGRDL